MTEGEIDATKALRELVETGRISKLFPVKYGDELITSIILDVVGPVSVIETTAHDEIPLEDKSRMIVAWTDETEGQRRAVLKAIAGAKTDKLKSVDEATIEAIQAIQVLLEPAEIVFPACLDELAEKFPACKPEARRAFVRIVALAEASALLHQWQRDRRDARIVASSDDLKLSLMLLRPCVESGLGGGAPPAVVRVWERIRDRTDEFTTTRLAEALKQHKRGVGRALKALEDAGAIRVVGGFARGRAKTYAVQNPDWEPGRIDSLINLF